MKITALRTRLAVALLCAAPFLLATAARADLVTGSVAERLWPTVVLAPPAGGSGATATVGGVLAISFSAKTDIDPTAIVAAMPRAITSGHTDPDGKTLRFVLAQP